MDEANCNNFDARNHALKLLCKQDYSQRALIQKMHAKGFASFEIEDVLAQLKKDGLFDEKRYTRRRIRQLISKGYSRHFIKSSLDRSDIPVSMEFIEEIFDELKTTEQKQIEKLIRLKKRRYDKLKIFRHLLSRGHDRELCESLLEEECQAS